MPRGAPKGNQYAKKAEGEHKEGISVSYYLDAYEYEFLQKSVEYDGDKPTDAKVRRKVKKLTKAAITEEMARVFAQYKAKEEAAN